MSWLRIDDGFPSHPKVATLRDRDFRAHIEALCYCARYLTDGVISSPVAEKQWRRSIGPLLEAGLWEERTYGEYVIHDFLDYNRSAATIRAEREATRKRQERWVERARNSVTNGVSDANSNAVTNGNPDPTRPDQTQEPQALGSVLASLSLAEGLPQAAEEGEPRAWWDRSNGLVDHDEQYLLSRLWPLGNWKALRKSRYLQLRTEYGRPVMKVALQDAWGEGLEVEEPNAMLGQIVAMKAAQA